MTQERLNRYGAANRRALLAAARAWLKWPRSGRTTLKVLIPLASVALLLLSQSLFHPRSWATPGRHQRSRSAPVIRFRTLIIVNTLTDEDLGLDGNCSLREAIITANAAGAVNNDCAQGTGFDEIRFSVSGTITLGSALPAVQNDLIIDGTKQTIAVDGAAAFQVFAVNSGAILALNNLTIQNGNNAQGGAIYNSGTLTVTNSTFTNDKSNATSGGAIANEGGSLNVSKSTFYINNAATNGGAIANDSGSGTISNSTFYGNGAFGNGGAIYNGPNQLFVLTNSTFQANAASTSAGGLFNDNGGVLKVSGSILTTIEAGGPDCGGTPISDQGYNIDDDSSCAFANSSATKGVNGQTLGDGVDPMLDPNGPQNHGGPTQTIALHFTSPAIDAIPTAQCPATDQRGFARPDSGETGTAACDVGAYESNEPIYVNTGTDESTAGDKLCSLREAINNANNPGTDTTGGDCNVASGIDEIVINVFSGKITLGSSLPAIGGNLTIQGPGQAVPVVGNGSFQLLSSRPPPQLFCRI